jgi:peptide/nickel transport system permease protein
LSGYLLRRLLAALPLLFGAATLVFLILHLVPGDPARLMLGPGASDADVSAYRARLGLDLPLASQYLEFVGRLVRGDLGRSLHYDDAVTSLLAERFPSTLRLGLAALAAAILLAVPAGIAAVLWRGGLFDRGLAILSAVAVAMPSFWLGPILVVLFSIRLRWLPVSGADAPGALILPAATLALPVAALLARLLSVALLEEWHAPYVVAARARGLGNAGALRHAAKNAAGPVLTALGLQTGALLTGAILTETVFAWPGVGRLLVHGITYRDYPLVQGLVLAFAAVYLLANLLADVGRAALDRRLVAS